MKYLVPIGGFTDHDFGILASPGTYGIPEGIRNGMAWAGDNQAFTKGFHPDRFFSWLKRMEPYRNNCLFIACPDKVYDVAGTQSLFIQWRDSFGSWPVAFVAQDRQEEFILPPHDTWDCLFVGGSTEWKMSAAAVDCIQRAQYYGKRIHIGRVNYWQRYQYFQSLEESEDFTCDGTRTRYEHDRAIIAWRKYMARPKQYGLPIFGSYRDSKSDCSKIWPIRNDYQRSIIYRT